MNAEYLVCILSITSKSTLSTEIIASTYGVKLEGRILDKILCTVGDTVI
jgi:hypothetical protein